MLTLIHGFWSIFPFLAPLCGVENSSGAPCSLPAGPHLFPSTVHNSPSITDCVWGTVCSDRGHAARQYRR